MFRWAGMMAHRSASVHGDRLHMHAPAGVDANALGVAIPRFEGVSESEPEERSVQTAEKHKREKDVARGEPRQDEQDHAQAEQVSDAQHEAGDSVSVIPRHAIGDARFADQVFPVNIPAK